MAEVAPPLGSFDESGEDPMDAFHRAFPTGAFTALFNVTGQPAISLPLHWTEEGVPVGVQLVAPFGREDLLIRVAAQLERAEPWAERTPARVRRANVITMDDGGRSAESSPPWRPRSTRTARSTTLRRARLAVHLLEHGSDGLVVAGHHRRVGDARRRREDRPAARACGARSGRTPC